MRKCALDGKVIPPPCEPSFVLDHVASAKFCCPSRVSSPVDGAQRKPLDATCKFKISGGERQHILDNAYIEPQLLGIGSTPSDGVCAESAQG
jgi:hypothetical protein